MEVDWYIRDEGYTKALGDIANFHHKQPFSSYWGEGITSSLLAQVNGKYGHDPGVSFYTYIINIHLFYIQVISSPEGAPHIINGLLYHETDL